MGLSRRPFSFSSFWGLMSLSWVMICWQLLGFFFSLAMRTEFSWVCEEDKANVHFLAPPCEEVRRHCSRKALRSGVVRKPEYISFACWAPATPADTSLAKHVNMLERLRLCAAAGVSSFTTDLFPATRRLGVPALLPGVPILPMVSEQLQPKIGDPGEHSSRNS